MSKIYKVGKKYKPEKVRRKLRSFADVPLNTEIIKEQMGEWLEEYFKQNPDIPRPVDYKKVSTEQAAHAFLLHAQRLCSCGDTTRKLACPVQRTLEIQEHKAMLKRMEELKLKDKDNNNDKEKKKFTIQTIYPANTGLAPEVVETNSLLQ